MVKTCYVNDAHFQSKSFKMGRREYKLIKMLKMMWKKI